MGGVGWLVRYVVDGRTRVNWDAGIWKTNLGLIWEFTRVTTCVPYIATL